MKNWKQKNTIGIFTVSLFVLIIIACDSGNGYNNVNGNKNCDCTANGNDNNSTTTSITISGTPKTGETITATVNGKFYGDISWLWSRNNNFLESYILSTGPTKVITIPNVIGGFMANGVYLRARVDKAGNGDYVYSNIIGPVSIY